MEALEWWRKLSQLEQIEMVWKYSDEKDFVYVSKSSSQIQKLYILVTASKTDAIAQNKWRIENREQLREQRKQELKELMEKDKQDQFGDTNKMEGIVNWLEQEFLKLESTVGVHGVFYELLEKAKQIESYRMTQQLEEGRELGQIEILAQGATKDASTYADGYSQGYTRALDLVELRIEELKTIVYNRTLELIHSRIKELRDNHTDVFHHSGEAKEMIGVVEWLVNQVEDFIGLIPVDIVEQAIQKQRWEHGQTWDASMDNYKARGENYARAYGDFDDYYKQKFGGNDEQQ